MSGGFTVGVLEGGSYIISEVECPLAAAEEKVRGQNLSGMAKTEPDRWSVGRGTTTNIWKTLPAFYGSLRSILHRKKDCLTERYGVHQ